MAHCKEQDLEDLDELLDKIRKLEKLKERKKGIFYPVFRTSKTNLNDLRNHLT